MEERYCLGGCIDEIIDCVKVKEGIEYKSTEIKELELFILELIDWRIFIYSIYDVLECFIFHLHHMNKKTPINIPEIQKLAQNNLQIIWGENDFISLNYIDLCYSCVYLSIETTRKTGINIKTEEFMKYGGSPKMRAILPSVARCLGIEENIRISGKLGDVESPISVLTPKIIQQKVPIVGENHSQRKVQKKGSKCEKENMNAMV